MQAAGDGVGGPCECSQIVRFQQREGLHARQDAVLQPLFSRIVLSMVIKNELYVLRCEP